ncbi:hypothetical protein LXD69_07160 [Flavobacterium sediminilitoris]|uniref:Uncharacterized protein n=1 Tax=Flavobacterium sediminilitoris TaxID=2024526 RepID=A0ABY4HUQ6_9FLAO|nr:MULTISPECIES: hypothetical protein [Flavobacterium]UOX35289.1 hypothetical protein LXD69_07160 [Flavobacterium sediminilitoris]
MRRGVPKYRLIQSHLDELGIMTTIHKTGKNEYSFMINGVIVKIYKKRENANKKLLKLIKENATRPIGLYGCYCHPFKDWPEHDKFFTQKLTAGKKVKVRCCGTVAELVKKLPNGFWQLKTDQEELIKEHTQNLITIKN